MKSITIFLTLVLGIIPLHGQYTVQADTPPPHPIDKKYDGKLEFLGSNQEMEKNIGKAEADWRALMDENLRLLMEKLPPTRRKQLRESQKAWEDALSLDRIFFFNDPAELRHALGREGEILSKMEFMHRVKKRALDLTEYMSIFASRDEEEQKRSSSTPMVFFPRIETEKK
ncbi:MAG: hypothetical protein K0R17_1253 [Rariglobus sp.]|jgi:hypothetical protein|nr:hypothetical protein [Rariglobus sp.]